MIIDGLPTLATPATGDEIPIERGTTTYKIDYNALATAIISKLGDPVGVGHGGSGLTASPSLLVNLASAAAANVMQASPRPGVTGTLPASHGGTGQTSLQAARNAMGLGNTSGALPIANGGTGATTAENAIAALMPSAVVEPSLNNNVSLRAGGYMKFGRIVVICAAFTTTAAYNYSTAFFWVPSPIISGSIDNIGCITINAGSTSYQGRIYNTGVYCNQGLAAGNYVATGVYISAS